MAFLVKGPIYLVCISCTEEPYESLRGQLELLYGQVTYFSPQTHAQKIFLYLVHISVFLCLPVSLDDCLPVFLPKLVRLLKYLHRCIPLTVVMH